MKCSSFLLPHGLDFLNQKTELRSLGAFLTPTAHPAGGSEAALRGGHHAALRSVGASAGAWCSRPASRPLRAHPGARRPAAGALRVHLSTKAGKKHLATGGVKPLIRFLWTVLFLFPLLGVPFSFSPTLHMHHICKIYIINPKNVNKNRTDHSPTVCGRQARGQRVRSSRQTT